MYSLVNSLKYNSQNEMPLTVLFSKTPVEEHVLITTLERVGEMLGDGSISRVKIPTLCYDPQATSSKMLTDYVSTSNYECLECDCGYDVSGNIAPMRYLDEMRSDEKVIIFWDGIDENIACIIKELRNAVDNSAYIVLTDVPNPKLVSNATEILGLMVCHKYLTSEPTTRSLSGFTPNDLLLCITDLVNKCIISWGVIPNLIRDMVRMGGLVVDELPPHMFHSEEIIKLRKLGYTPVDLSNCSDAINNWRNSVMPISVNIAMIKFEFGILAPSILECKNTPEDGGIMQVSVKVGHARPLELVIQHDEEDLINKIDSQIYMERRDLVERCIKSKLSLDAAGDAISAYLYANGAIPTNPRKNQYTYLAGYQTEVVAAYLSKNFDNLISWFEDQLIDVRQPVIQYDYDSLYDIGLSFNPDLFLFEPTKYLDYLASTLELDNVDL